MVLSNRLLINIICVAAFLCSFKAVATDDDYLKMLEGEAEDLVLDESGQLKELADKNSKEDFTKKDWKWDGNVLPSGLAQGEFVLFLKQNLYGSYAFFRKLNSMDQQTVFYHYTKSSPALIDTVRQDILDQLKK